jgi:hypothetical protein
MVTGCVTAVSASASTRFANSANEILIHASFSLCQNLSIDASFDKRYRSSMYRLTNRLGAPMKLTQHVDYILYQSPDRAASHARSDARRREMSPYA